MNNQQSILVLEQDDLVRNLICLVLEREGHLVFEASDAAAACRMVEFEMFDIIVTDAKTSGLGLTLLSLLKSSSNARFLFVAEPGLNETGLAQYSQFADHCVFKPIVVQDFISAIRNLIVKPLNRSSP